MCVKKILESRADELMSSVHFPSAVLDHHKNIILLFSKNRLFYKSAFKSNRFLIALQLFCDFYTKSNPYLDDLKSACLDMNLISLNPLNSFIMTLRVTNRISVSKSIDDKRKLVFKPTQKANNEAISFIESITKSISMITDTHYDISNEISLRHFFIRYSDVIYSKNYMHLILPESSIFIHRDSGHMMLLSLYTRYIVSNNVQFKYELFHVAHECGVSRSHLRRCIADAQIMGLVHFDSVTSLITVTKELIDIASRYMAIYFSAIEYGFRERNQ